MAKYVPDSRKVAQVELMFTYHPPKDDQAARYEKIRSAARAFGTILIEEVPECRELSMALTNLQLATMCANAGIACNE